DLHRHARGDAAWRVGDLAVDAEGFRRRILRALRPERDGRGEADDRQGERTSQHDSLLLNLPRHGEQLDRFAAEVVYLYAGRVAGLHLRGSRHYTFADAGGIHFQLDDGDVVARTRLGARQPGADEVDRTLRHERDGAPLLVLDFTRPPDRERL